MYLATRRHARVLDLARAEDGSALLTSLVVLAVLLAIGGIAVFNAAANSRSADVSSATTESFALAEAGVAQGLAILNTPANNRTSASLLPTTTTTMQTGATTWNGTYDVASATWTVNGTGSVTNPTGAAPIQQKWTRKVWIGEIVFESNYQASNSSWDWDVRAIAQDGSAVRTLTNVTTNERSPRWSPDGRRVLFMDDSAKDALPNAGGGAGENWDLYVMNVNGTGKTRVTTNKGKANWWWSSFDGRPTWGPGESAVFVSSQNSAGGSSSGPASQRYNDDGYFVKLDGTKEQNLTTCNLAPPHNYWTNGSSCSHDWQITYGAGKLCVKSDAQGGWGLHVMTMSVDAAGNVTTGTPTKVVPYHAYECEISPDGSRIVYISEVNGPTNIYVKDLVSGTITRLTNGSWTDKSPQWLADGRIVFTSNRTSSAVNVSNADGGTEIFVMNGDGTGAKQLTFTPGGAYHGDLDTRAVFLPDTD